MSSTPINKSQSKDEKYRIFFENSTDAMLIIKDYLFVDCNLATVKMLGYDKKEELLNAHPSELSPEFQPDGKKSYDKAIEMMEAAFAKGSHHFEWNHKKKNGEVFPVDVSLTAIPSDNEIILHTVWRDITKRKKYEKEIVKMQKLQSLGELAGGLAHDFNNVLSGVFGNISLARLELDKRHPAYESIQHAEEALELAKNLTNQLLTFAKGGEPLKENQNIEELVKEVTLFTLAGSNITPVFRNKEGELWSEIDRGQIQQVITNMIINADQAMPNGGNLYITLKRKTVSNDIMQNLNDGEYIKIEIKDDGMGISPQHLNSIFDPYFTTKNTGNGLGLSSAFSIIKKHNGNISVSSEQEKGTTFTIYLPASKPSPPQATTIVTKKKNLPEGLRILVMDDEEIVRKTTAKMLKSFGCSAVVSKDGEQAIEKYKEAMDSGMPFDAVFMDLTIPGGMGGKDAIRNLLKIAPQAKVIVASGYSNDPIMADYASYGFKGRLVKPFLAKDLLKELISLICK